MKLIRLKGLGYKHDILTDYEAPDYEPYIIVDNKGTPLCYLWTPKLENPLYIEMIEVIDKEKGIGTQVVRFLFKELNLNEIFGEVMRTTSERPYYFWESLGAEFECHIDDAFDSGYKIPFCLDNSQLL